MIRSKSSMSHTVLLRPAAAPVHFYAAVDIRVIDGDTRLSLDRAELG